MNRPTHEDAERVNALIDAYCGPKALLLDCRKYPNRDGATLSRLLKKCHQQPLVVEYMVRRLGGSWDAVWAQTYDFIAEVVAYAEAVGLPDSSISSALAHPAGMPASEGGEITSSQRALVEEAKELLMTAGLGVSERRYRSPLGTNVSLVVFIPAEPEDRQ